MHNLNMLNTHSLARCETQTTKKKTFNEIYNKCRLTGFWNSIWKNEISKVEWEKTV